MRTLAIMGLMVMTCGAWAQDARFIDHGVGAAVAESRGMVVFEGADGQGMALCLSLDQSPRGWMLLVNVDSRETEQFYYPEGVPNSAPFASLMSNNGRFYTFAGNVLLEFAPQDREWLFNGRPAPGENCVTGSAMVDGPGGLIYAGTYPSCRLVSYDPETQEMRDYGRLDDAEHYVNTLVPDDAGWLYAGIGTARQNVVAFNVTTGERIQIPSEDNRPLGSGHVQVGADGQVYGRAGDTWWRLHAGEAEEIPADQVPASQPTGAIGWGQRSGRLPDGTQVSIDLPNKTVTVTRPEGETESFAIDYESEGASITSIAEGPDGRIYASTCHPMHLVSYDPQADVLTDLGPVPTIGGGNMCAMTAAGDMLYAASYAGGHIWRYDPAAPWQPGDEETPNPVAIAQYKSDLCRPRACVTDATQRWVVSGGFAGYGLCGGGLAIHDRETGETELLTHEAVIPYESTITMRFLPDGTLVGGTSIATPGGGHPQRQEGTLYLLDLESREVIFRTNPVEGASEVFSIEIGPDGLVYGLASGAQFFVFDPESREVVHREDLSAYGGLPRQTLVLGPDGNIYATFTAAIVRITPGTFAHEKLADPPRGISAGAVIHDGRLYYASGSHVWSFDLGLD